MKFTELSEFEWTENENGNWVRRDGYDDPIATVFKLKHGLSEGEWTAIRDGLILKGRYESASEAMKATEESWTIEKRWLMMRPKL